MTVPVDPDGALPVYSAVGDAFAGRRIGFGRRRAALAANFARHRGRDDDAVAASWVAGLLAEIGCAAGGADGGEQPAGPTGPLPMDPDAPLHGARLIAALPGLPAGTADLVRWHRERDDGTGVPDRLRWDGIPADAAALGIAHRFVELIEDPDEPRAPEEAVFAITAESGRAFAVELVRAFREFLATTPDGWDAPPAGAAPPIGIQDIVNAVSNPAEGFTPRLPVAELAERVNAAVGATVADPQLIITLVTGTHAFYASSGAPA